MKRIDLLIIGAGPGGLSTALHLLQAKPSWASRMLVIEKAEHPREKLCAGGLTPLGIDILNKLDFPFPLPLSQFSVKAANFVCDGRTFQVKGSPRFIVFNRIEFDHYLAQTARERGVRIHENEAARTLDVARDGVTVTTSRDTYHAKAVVGADGSKGVVRRLIKRNLPQKKAISLRTARLLEVRVPALSESALFAEGQAVFDFSSTKQDLQGYVWDFPSWVEGRPYANRGIYDARIAAQRPKAKLLAALNNALAEDGYKPDEIKLEGHPLHWFSPTNRFSVPRILCVGDAAGVDPLFGEGIGPALGYGKIAACELENAYAWDDFSFSQYKQHILFSQLGWYLLWRWGAARVAYRLSGHPRFMRALWRVAQVGAGGYNAVFGK